MNFNALIGHENVKDSLRAMLLSERLPHALLFSGPDGIGKRFAACLAAAALNCRYPDDAGACGECISCRQLASGNHPQIFFIGSTRRESEIKIDLPSCGSVIRNLIPDSSSGSRATVKINIEQIREVARLATLKALGGGKKVFIIDDISDASLPALNSLLKVLEEPPGNTFFILITNKEVSLLQTIVSRCWRVEFFSLNTQSMKVFIKESLPEEDIPEDLIYAASGSPGRLLRYIHASKVGLSDIPPEKFFSEVKSWYTGADAIEKIMMLLEIEAVSFRENPDEEGYRRIALIQAALSDLKMNANTDLTISNLFLKLDAVDL